VKIDPEGSRKALFDPAHFLSWARPPDAFSPASDGGMDQIAQSGVLKPTSTCCILFRRIAFVGDASDADFEVYTLRPLPMEISALGRAARRAG